MEIQEVSQEIRDMCMTFNRNGEAVGVKDAYVFMYIKIDYKMFVLSGVVYFYDNGVYVPDKTGSLLQSIIQRYIYVDVIKSTTVSRIHKLFFMDEELEKTYSEINNYPDYWVNFKNGFWDAKSGKMIEHNPKYLAINQIPHEYNPTPINHGYMDNFLNFAIPNPLNQKMLIQFLAVGCTKDTSFQKFLTLLGSGGNGKSIIIRLAEYIYGEINISNISLSDIDKRFSSIHLLGKLVNSCADIEVGVLENTSTLKKLLGEDTVFGEHKGKDGISFKSYAKLIFSTNVLPTIKGDTSNGFYRRMLILEMNKKPKKVNPNLFEDLLPDIPYLIKRMMDELHKVYTTGEIFVSEDSKKAVEQMNMDSDTAQAFINELCCIGEEFKTDRTYLFDKYVSYCNECERQPLTRNNFFKALRTKGFREVRSSNTRYFAGIKVSQTDMEKCHFSDEEEAFLNVLQEDTPFEVKKMTV